MDADPHVHIDPGHLADQAAKIGVKIRLGKMFGRQYYAMASIMSMPSSTQQWAWSGRDSGTPHTQ